MLTIRRHRRRTSARPRRRAAAMDSRLEWNNRISRSLLHAHAVTQTHRPSAIHSCSWWPGAYYKCMQGYCRLLLSNRRQPINCSTCRQESSNNSDHLLSVILLCSLRMHAWITHAVMHARTCSTPQILI